MSRLEAALACLRSGNAVLLIDEDREASAHLVAASSLATPEVLSDLIDHGHGPVSVVSPKRAGVPADGSSAASIVSGCIAAISAALAPVAGHAARGDGRLD